MIEAQPVRTEVRYKRTSDNRIVSDPNGKVWWVLWKPTTVQRWQAILTDSNYGSADIQRLCWKRMLLDTNLIPTGGPFPDEHTPDTVYQRIMDFSPPHIPRDLVNQLIDTTYVSTAEQNEIEQQCQLLWLGKNGSVKKPHPLLGLTVEMMNIEDQFGIPGYRSIGEIPYRLYSAMKIISRTKGQIQQILSQTQASHQRALQMGRGLIPESEWAMYENGPPTGIPAQSK